MRFVASATANASVTIGSNLAATPSGGVVGNLMLANASLPTTAPGGLFAPQNGVVVYWAVRSSAPSDTDDTVRLRILNGNTATGRVVGTGRPGGRRDHRLRGADPDLDRGANRG